MPTPFCPWVFAQERVAAMVLVRKSLPLLLLSVAALLVALAWPAASEAQQKQKTPPKTDKPTPAPKPDFEEAEVLKQAYLLLLGANHDYDGHRAKAYKAVKDAFKALDASVKKTGTPQQKDAVVKEAAAIAAAEKAAKNAPMVHEPQPASDALLSRAKGLLTQVSPLLAKNNPKPVLNHVKTAIAEIDTALKISAAAKGKVGTQFAEAELLRKAYLLLLEGDADYDGHRAKAMGAVKDAVTALDKHVTAFGTDQQKAVMAKESTEIAAAETARKKAGSMPENQLVSDALLTGAKEVLAELRPTLVQNKQHKTILAKVDSAINEIGLALSIR
jgi:hypothetical protein